MMQLHPIDLLSLSRGCRLCGLLLAESANCHRPGSSTERRPLEGCCRRALPLTVVPRVGVTLIDRAASAVNGCTIESALLPSLLQPGRVCGCVGSCWSGWDGVRVMRRTRCCRERGPRPVPPQRVACLTPPHTSTSNRAWIPSERDTVGESARVGFISPVGFRLGFCDRLQIGKRSGFTA